MQNYPPFFQLKHFALRAKCKATASFCANTKLIMSESYITANQTCI